MRVVVPFALENPKTRLAPVLSPDEREEIARAMLVDILATLEAVGAASTVLTTGPLDTEQVAGDDEFDPTAISTIVDDRPLTTAVNDVLETIGSRTDIGQESDGEGRGGADGRESDTEGGAETDAIAIVMADLALASPAALEELFSTDGDVVVAPGRGGGTNALVVRHPDFRVDYHGASYLDHLRQARTVDATVETVDSFRLSTDVDEPDDLVEVLIHTDGATRAALEGMGFELETGAGRVTVDRTE